MSKADLLGSVYLIDFWGYLVRSLRRTSLKIREVWEEYRERDFQVLSVAVGNSPELIRIS